MNQIVIITVSRVVITWLLLGIANAKIDFQQGSSRTSAGSRQYFNEQPSGAVHRAQQQQLDDDYSIRRPYDKTAAALSWVDYKRSHARPYSFNYVVNNDVDDNYYGHRQASDGSVTTGTYRVRLPDGRTQIVDFTADRHNGYVAHVKYDKVSSNYNTKSKKPSVVKSLNYKNYKKKPWTAFNNKNNNNKNNQLTSYKADLIAAFRLKINNNQILTSSNKTNVDVIAEQPAIAEYASTSKYDEDANIRSWTALNNKETPIHEAKAVYHQQSDYETSSISTPIIIDKTTTLLTPIHYRANYQPINQTTTSRNGPYDYVAPTTYRPAIPYYYNNIPSSSSSLTIRQPPAYWTWLTTNYGSITTSAPFNYKQPATDYLNYTGRLPTPLIFRTARHNSLLRSDYSSND